MAVAAGIVPDDLPKGTTMTGSTTTSRGKARASQSKVATDAPGPAKSPSKLDQVEALLLMPTGTTIPDIMAATGWQQHSVRGAMAGALKKRGLMITSDKVDRLRRYRASKPAS